MEQILVNRVNGTSYPLEDRSVFRVIKSIKQITELRTNDVINIEIEAREYFSFTIGDNFKYLDKVYTLNQIPQIIKIASNQFKYTITFEGVQFDLRRVSYDVNIDTTGSAVYGETLTANLELFLKVLISNANRVFPSKWVLGQFPTDSETKTMVFSEEENCLNVLQNICTEYDTDFVIKTAPNGVNTLHILKVGEDIPLEFKVGFQQGLYNLSRDKVDSNDIVTRLKVYGSTKNLGTDYRANRLVLAGKNKSNSYIDNTPGVAKYGIYEATKIYEDIYPRRKGKVTSISSESVYKFSDSSMGFDLKERDENGTKYLLDGVSAKIHFNTGNLAGYEFEVHDYNHTTKEFHIIKLTDENDYQFPSSDNNVFRIGVGDEYVILDIKMPQSYIDNAEAELLEKATEYLSEKQEPLVQYTLAIDTLFLQRTLNETVSEFFSIGDFVKVVDVDLDLNRYIRIKSIERDLSNPFDYKLTLSDAKVTTSIVTTILTDITTINNVIRLNNLNDPARARRNWRDAQEVMDMVFDPEGDYYTEKIKPLSIDTSHLQVGAKSMQFTLVNSFFEPNFEGNPNKIRWSDCKLIHFTIDENIKEWNLQAGQKDLEANKPYYMYARCNKANNIGVIEITETQFTVDQGNYYYFLIGIVNSYDSSVKAREISLMYGFTTISGRFIKTGRIESSGGGDTYFDLDTGEISGRITFHSNSPAFQQIYDGIVIGGENILIQSGEQLEGYEIDEVKKLRYKGQLKDYCFSIDASFDRLLDVGFYVIGKLENGTAQSLGYKIFKIEKINERFRLHASFNIDLSKYRKIFAVIKDDNNDNATVNAEFFEPKLELGNIPTDYSPSTYDINQYNEDRIKEFTDKVNFLSTTIDGNIMATGMLMVGSANQSNAGISGFTEAGEDSVRFWAGGTATNRTNATFRVLDNGKVYMSDAYIRGEVQAETGQIAGFTINNKVLSTQLNNSGIWFTFENSNYNSSIRIGNNIGSSVGAGSWVGKYTPSIIIENFMVNPSMPIEDFKGGIYLNIKNEGAPGIQTVPAIEIENGHIKGLALGVQPYLSGETIINTADIVWVTNNAGNTAEIYLPDVPRVGKVITILNPDPTIQTITVRSRFDSIASKWLHPDRSLTFSYRIVLVFIGNGWIEIYRN